MIWEIMLLQRKRKNMSQKELANKIGTNDITISRIEKGQQIPKADTLLKIAIALDISVDVLLTDLKKSIIEEKSCI